MRSTRGIGRRRMARGHLTKVNGYDQSNFSQEPAVARAESIESSFRHFPTSRRARFALSLENTAFFWRRVRTKKKSMEVSNRENREFLDDYR